MALPVVYRHEAGRDLAGASGWYEEQRVGLGEEFLAAVDLTFDAIERFPEAFRRVHGEVRRANVSRFPYAVFYRIDPRHVLILAIVHTARDPTLWPRARDRAR